MLLRLVAMLWHPVTPFCSNSDIKIWRTPGYYLEADDAEGNGTKFGPGMVAQH